MSKVLFLREYDDAIVGVIDELDPCRIVYSKRKMIDILVRDGMDKLDAIEHLEYNVWCAYKGKYTPIYLNDLIGTNREELIEYIVAVD